LEVGCGAGERHRSKIIALGFRAFGGAPEPAKRFSRITTAPERRRGL
jgi:hypothetical protein